MFTHVLSFKYLNMLLAASASTPTTTTPTVADAVADVAAVAFEVLHVLLSVLNQKPNCYPDCLYWLYIQGNSVERRARKNHIKHTRKH